MTAEPLPADPQARSADLALARLHLRLGSLALARAELETLAGRDALDHEGVLDLVEARWRTGDLAGAGEAAELVLDADGDGPLIALIVAAEVAVQRGRPTEGRRSADRAVASAGAALDAVFAGMPRGPIWPADATDQPPTSPTLFDAPRAASSAGRPPPGPRVGSATVTAAAGPEPETLGLWAATDTSAPSGPAEPSAPDAADAPAVAVDLAATPAAAPASRPEPGPAATPESADPRDAAPDASAASPEATDLVALAGVSLASGAVADAAVALGLALRTDPAAAAAVLDLVGDRADPGLALVRGDAYRLVGREAEARQAFAIAARRLGDAASPASDPPPTSADPAPLDPPSPEGDPA